MRVLHAIHDFLPRHLAGSEIYAFELCRALAGLGHQVHVLCADYDPGRCHGSLTWRWFEGLPVTELVNNWRFSSFRETYASHHLGGQLEHALQTIQPDVLHVHNLLNLSFDLPAIAARQGIPSVATLHEYALLCPSGGQRVHLAEEHVCYDIEPERCARCFIQSPLHAQMAVASVTRNRPLLAAASRAAALLRGLAPRLVAGLGRAATTHAGRNSLDAEQIEERLQAAQRVLETVDLFVAPSPALGAEFLRFGLHEKRLEVSDNGFVPLEIGQRPPRGPSLRLGFVGTLVWHKGAHVLLDALRRLPSEGWELTIHAGLDTFPDYVARLRRAAADLPVRFAGGFAREHAGRVYAGLDALVVSSLWPENSPLVIHEAFMTGVPVVGSRMGGIVNLVEDEVNGLLYDAFSADDLGACLMRLIDEPGLVERLAAAAPEVKTIDQDARDWVERYRRVLARRAGTVAPA